MKKEKPRTDFPCQLSVFLYTIVISVTNHLYTETGALQVLSGNLAPNGSITKPGAFAPSLHYYLGKAKVYDGEEAANKAILKNEIEDGDVVVIRYEGPKGGPIALVEIS